MKKFFGEKFSDLIEKLAHREEKFTELGTLLEKLTGVNRVETMDLRVGRATIFVYMFSSESNIPPIPCVVVAAMEPVFRAIEAKYAK